MHEQVRVHSTHQEQQAVAELHWYRPSDFPSVTKEQMSSKIAIRRKSLDRGYNGITTDIQI